MKILAEDKMNKREISSSSKLGINQLKTQYFVSQYTVFIVKQGRGAFFILWVA